MSIELCCPKHPKRKYFAEPKRSSCSACEDIYHLIRERRELTECWAFTIVLENGEKI